MKILSKFSNNFTNKFTYNFLLNNCFVFTKNKLKFKDTTFKYHYSNKNIFKMEDSFKEKLKNIGKPSFLIIQFFFLK